jgi:hypothetical protein
MSNIDTTADSLDVRDLAEIAEAALETIALAEDPETEADDKPDDDELAEAREDLEILAAALAEFGCSVDDDRSNVPDELRSIGDNNGPTIVSEDGLADYVREFIEDCGYIPADLPAIISNNLDWEGIVDDFKADSTSFELDGQTFYTT